MSTYRFKGFTIERMEAGHWNVYASTGSKVDSFNTLKEAKAYILKIV